MPETIISPPDCLKIARLTVTARSKVGVTEGVFDYSRQMQDWKADRWELGLTLPPMARADAAEVIGFLHRVRHGEKFWFGVLGQERYPRGVATGTPIVRDASGTVSGNTLHTSGWTHSITGILLAGDFAQVGNHLFQLRQAANSDSSGYADLDLWPAPHAPYPAAGEAVVVTSAKGVFQLAEFKTDWDLSTAQQYGMGFNILEAM